jgi:hypothetical protein
MAKSYDVSCHCGNIRLEVTAELGEVTECNCSICVRSGFLHWYVAPQQVKLKTKSKGLSTYIWRSTSGGQHFCSTCGIPIFRTSIEHPPPLSINARCIEGIEVGTLTIRQFDGRHEYP